MRGSREQITLTLRSETLDRSDRLAHEAGIAQGGLLNLVILRGLWVGL